MSDFKRLNIAIVAFSMWATNGSQQKQHWHQSAPFDMCPSRHTRTHSPRLRRKERARNKQMNEQAIAIYEGQSNCYSWVLNTVQWEFKSHSFVYNILHSYPYGYAEGSESCRAQCEINQTDTHTQTQNPNTTSHKWMDENYSCKSWHRLNEF